MSDVTMIGLGAMGSALARTMLGAGHVVTVWNRSPEKTAPLVESGAHAAASLPEALAASPVVVVCIDSYDSTRAMLEDDNALQELRGRTLVQLSTGTPSEARDLQALLSPAGCSYLDGAIMPYPEGIGREDARLLFAGPKSVWETARPVLDCLGGDLRYLGENITAAAVLDMGFLTYELCNYLAALHGALVCEAEGVDLDLLVESYEEDSPPRRLAGVIRSGEFGDPGATLEVWRAALGRVRDQATGSGINSEIPDLIASLFDRAIAAGYGEEDVAAVIKVLRGRAETGAREVRPGR